MNRSLIGEIILLKIKDRLRKINHDQLDPAWRNPRVPRLRAARHLQNLRDRRQCTLEVEKTFTTTTPAMISPMPASAAPSSAWRNQIQPIAEISTMPTPDQIA